MQNGLKMWGKHSKPSSGGTMARFKNLCGHVIWKPHALDDIYKNLVVVAILQDEAANHGIESIVTIHENVDGGNLKESGIVHECEQGVVCKITSFTWKPSELIIPKKVCGEIDGLGAERPLLHFPKYVTEKNGPE